MARLCYTRGAPATIYSLFEGVAHTLHEGQILGGVEAARGLPVVGDPRHAPALFLGLP